MDQAISDEAAIAFAVGFYQALGAGRSIEQAYRLGCVQVRLQGYPDSSMPISITTASSGCTANKTAEQIQEKGFLTIDSQPLLGESGKVGVVSFDQFVTISDLMDSIWLSLENHVPPFTYRKRWLIQDANSGRIFQDIQSGLADDGKHTRDNRTLRQADILPGMRLEVIPVFDLTEYEREILGQLAKGLADEEIARQLQTSEMTVYKLISRICRKLRAKNLSEAIVIATNHHLIR